MPLSTSGVQSLLLQKLPPGGLTRESLDDAKVSAAAVLGQIWADVSILGLSAADKTYALNWMFKYADNPPPRDDFTDDDGYFSQQKLDEFEAERDKTRHKLLNHYQARYLVGADQKFKAGTLVHLKDKHKAVIGNTKDPSRFYEVTDWFSSYLQWAQNYPPNGLFPGQAGLNNDKFVENETGTKFCNEGHPDQRALTAFKNLTGHDQGEIWSSITFFSDLQHYSETNSATTGQSLTRAPKPQYFYEGRINTQVYPTYWMYINGKKHPVPQNQAPAPSALFPNTDKCQ